MRSEYSFDVHRDIEGARFRQRERELEHLRALKEDRPREGMMSRAVAGLARRRAKARPAIVEGVYVLTDRVCSLADGALGRIAIQESDGELVEVCVPA